MRIAAICLLWAAAPLSSIMAFQPSSTTILVLQQQQRTKKNRMTRKWSANDQESLKISSSSSSMALHDSRRDVLAWSTTTAVIMALGGVTFHPSLAAAAEVKPKDKKGPDDDYKAAARDIMRLVAANKAKGPTLVRLAWHSSGTYDKMAQDGGSGKGTIRFQEELAHGGNAGLARTAVKWLEPIHAKHPAVSYADLYTLAGVASIKALGGPTIPWRAGRVDALSPDNTVTPDGRLPSADSGEKGADKADADHLRTIFYRMGFDDREIVALSGAHALGRCHPKASGYKGPWTFTPTTFSNAYFTLLLNLKWVPKTWDGPFQYVDASTGHLMMLPTDLVLLQDEKFLTHVKTYANDRAKFNEDFTAAFQKLEELGTSNLKAVEWA
jgi:cytochrome c peroxidase